MRKRVIKVQNVSLHCLKRFCCLFLLVCSTFLCNNMVFASSDLKDSKLFTGTVALLKNISGVCTAIAGVLTAVLIMIQIIKLQTCDDEGEGRMIKKKIKKIAICGISIFFVVGILTIVLSFYGETLTW